MKGHFVKAQSEEVLIAVLVGALVGVAVTSLLSAGADGYLPSTAYGFTSWAHMLIFYVGLLGGGGLGGWYGVTQERDTHLSGARYYRDPKAAARALQAIQTAAMSPAQREHKVAGLTVGGVEIARAIEVAHLFISGLTRTGKTTIMRALIDQALARGDRMIVHDRKGDFIDAYYGPADSVILGPWHRRALVWDASADIANPTLADEFASMLFDTKNSGLKDPHWYIASAHVLSGLIKAHMRKGELWTWASLQRELAGDPIALIQTAARGDSTVKQHFATVFPPPGGKREPTIIPEQASILSTMADKIGWIANYSAVDTAKGEAARFSFSRWLRGTAHQNVRKVFLNYSALNSAASEQIFGSMLATIAAIVEDPTTPDHDPDEGNALLVILDEFAQLGSAALKATQSISELGGSRGVRAIIATQTPSQIVAHMGADKAKPVLEQQQTRIYTRSAPEAAEAIVGTAGEHEIERIQTTANNGAIMGKTKSTMREKVLQAGDVTGLRVIPHVGVEFILHSGSTLGKLVQPFGPKPRKSDISKEVSEVWTRGALPEIDDTHAAPPTPASDSTPVLETAPVNASEETGWAGDYSDSGGGEDDEDADAEANADTLADSDGAADANAGTDAEPAGDHDDPVAPAAPADPNDIPLE